MAAAAAVAKVNPEKVEPAKVKPDKAKPEPDNAKPEKNLDLKRLSTRDLVRSFWRARNIHHPFKTCITPLRR